MDRISQTAKNYSDALIKSDMSNDDIYNELKNVQEVLNSSEELCNILNNPTISVDKKIEIITEIFKSKINDEIFKFLIVLTEKNRINQFSEIFKSFQLQLEEINNIKHLEVISAVELTDEIKRRIVAKFENKFNKKFIPEWKISGDIIGGLVYKIDDNLIDASLKNKIENMRKIIK